jgi:tetratricopeptide (TPR) repeat protein
MGDLDRAEDYYHQALNIEFDIYAVIGLAMIHKARGNHLEAIESLTGLLVNNPKNPRLVIEIADSYMKLGNLNRAAEVLTRFIRIGGKNAQVSEMLERIKNIVASGSSSANR